MKELSMGTEDKDNRIILLKLSLYCISLWILMFMLIVLKIDMLSPTER